MAEKLKYEKFEAGLKEEIMRGLGVNEKSAEIRIDGILNYVFDKLCYENFFDVKGSISIKICSKEEFKVDIHPEYYFRAGDATDVLIYLHNAIKGAASEEVFEHLLDRFQGQKMELGYVYLRDKIICQKRRTGKMSYREISEKYHVTKENARKIYSRKNVTYNTKKSCNA